MREPGQVSGTPTPSAAGRTPLRLLRLGSSQNAGHLDSLSGLLVLAMMLAYILFFSAYSLQRHATLNSYAADLSFIDQPMWNTLHGRFLERTMDAGQVSRIAEHFEPIIIPIAFVFYLWDDVRAILVVQTLALALGALLVYWIARRALAGRVSDEADAPDGGGRPFATLRRVEWLPLAFVAAYLMFPALQAANVADFHADPFIVAPLLFAFWYATERRYVAMWAWAVIAMLVKENLPTMIFMLGLFVVLFGVTPETAAQAMRRRLQGAALMVVSLAWYYVATYLIVAPLAHQVYGTPGPVYMAHRYAWLSGGLAGLWDMLRQPERLRYLVELAAPVGWLALLAPEYLLLGLPVLGANFISDFPGQYSGQQHYTAPLVPVFVVAAIYGARRLMNFPPVVRWGGSGDRSAPSIAGPGHRRVRSARAQRIIAVGIVAWLIAWSLGYQYLRGWTPLGIGFIWPQLTPHDQLLARFTAQIPSDAAVSTTPPLHPHLAHRWKIYIYPMVADADYVLLDVAGRTDAHPNDVHNTFVSMTGSGEFGILDAADGYVLLSRQRAGTAGSGTLPDEFYDFARAGKVQPQYPVRVEFARSPQERPLLRLLGYDVIDDPIRQQTAVRLYWQALASLPENSQVWPFFLDEAGFVIEDTSQRPMVAPLWYPPWRWQPDETVVIETLPWPLGERFSIGVAVLDGKPGAAGGLADATRRLAVTDAGAGAIAHQDRSWVQVGDFRRTGRYLVKVPQEAPLARADVAFADGIRLVGYRYLAGADEVFLVLAWQAETPVAHDFTVFVHYVAPDGSIVAQSDAQPHWGADWPTGRWVPGEHVLDGHRLALLAGAASGPYAVHVGLYDWPNGPGAGQTLERLPVLDAAGNAVADYAVLKPLLEQ